MVLQTVEQKEQQKVAVLVGMLCSRVSDPLVREPICSGYIPFHSDDVVLLTVFKFGKCARQSTCFEEQSHALVEEVL